MQYGGWQYGRWIAIAAGVGLVLFYLRSIASAIFWIVSELVAGVIWIVTGIVHLIADIAVMVPVWAISASIGILAALIPIAAVAVVLFVLWLGLLTILKGFATLGSKLETISTDGRQAALDSGFLAVLAAGSAAVAYLATNEVLDKFYTLHFLAVASMSSCVGKSSLMMPARAAKWVGTAITLVAVVATIFFLANQYKKINWYAVEATRAFAFVMMALLMGTAVGYPFTIRGWKRLLRQLPSCNNNRVHG
jgi:hypothetical protein